MSNVNNHFTLTLDTLGPTGSITMTPDYVKSAALSGIIGGNKYLVITGSQNSTFMKVWTNGVGETDAGTKSDSAYLAASWEAFNTSKLSSCTSDGKWRYHLVLKDHLGNESGVYDTAIFGLDASNPVVARIDSYPKDVKLNGGTSISSSSTIPVQFGFNDLPNTTPPQSGGYDWTSDIQKVTLYIITKDDSQVRLTQDITSGWSWNATNNSYVYSGNVTCPSACDDKYVNAKIKIMDNVGHESDLSGASNDVLIDKTGASGTIHLYQAGTTTSLPSPTNLSSYDICIEITKTGTETSHDVTHYQCWGYDSYPTDPGVTGTWLDWGSSTAFTKTLSGIANTIQGSKTIDARLKDSAGNITELTGVSFVFDNVKPYYSITGCVGYSTLSGFYHYEKVDTYGHVTYVNNQGQGFTIKNVLIEDTTTSVPAGSAKIKVNDELTTKLIVNRSPAADETVLASDVTPIGLENTMYHMTLDLTDAAGNNYSPLIEKASVSEIFGYCKDTSAPNITNVTGWTFDGWNKSLSDITVTAADPGSNDGSGSGMRGVVAWISSSGAASDPPSGATEIAWGTGGSKVIPVSSIYGTPTQGNGNYLHIRVYDNVNNSTDSIKRFYFDSVKPTITGVSAPANINTLSFTLTWSGSDATSGIGAYKVTNAYVSGTGNWVTLSGSPTSGTPTVNFKSDTPDGTYTISFDLKDTAQNATDENPATTQTVTVTLDRSAPGATVVLYERGNVTSKADPSSDPKFVARIASTDASIEGYQYKIWGDFTTGDTPQSIGTTEPTTWSPLTYDSGKNYQTIGNLVCTTNPALHGETKVVHVKIIDKAQNPTEVTTSFVYDPVDPDVVISQVDFNEISKIHEARSGQASETYYDKMTFTITPNEDMYEVKVCAYLTKEQAHGVTNVETEAAIPSTPPLLPTDPYTHIEIDGHSTTHMKFVKSGSYSAWPGGAGKTAVLMGVDYEAALVARGGTAGGTCEGAHYVVVYAKDSTGHWSCLATIPE